jgi:hypothetical protein
MYYANGLGFHPFGGGSYATPVNLITGKYPSYPEDLDECIRTANGMQSRGDAWMLLTGFALVGGILVGKFLL